MIYFLGDEKGEREVKGNSYTLLRIFIFSWGGGSERKKTGGRKFITIFTIPVNTEKVPFSRDS